MKMVCVKCNIPKMCMNIRIGDTIVTSHLSNIFPEGITIGNVPEAYSEDKKDRNALCYYQPFC